MMTDREIMQQALDALELLSQQPTETALDYADNAITALREALAQPEQEQWDAIPDAFNEWWDSDYDDTGNPFRKECPAYWAWAGWKAASKQPEQGPVAKVELMLTGGAAGLATRIVEIDDHLRERLRPGQLLYTTPPQRTEQEHVIDCPRCGHCCPQRKPLTDDLYNELLFAVGNKYPNETRHQTALRYILQADKGDEKAAHGIKENT